jgi:hypothetical protein
MNWHHYIMTDFIEEISGFVLLEFGVIEMDRLNVGRGPALVHQRERGHRKNVVHDVCRHIEWGNFPFGLHRLVLCDFLSQIV